MRLLRSIFFRSGQAMALVLLLGLPAWAANEAAPDIILAAPGDAGRGRALFNGIGGCFNCHGYDGVLTRRPDYSPQLAEELSRLNPPPADLRNQADLKAQTEPDRFRSIKFGHPGTAMFPKKFLMDQELADLLAYLATLRAEGHGPAKP
ncbi:MAG: c-type cytochrome [Nitrospirota bacterium]|nr:c-type cytochrome [Nitrospirota bacterium]